MLTLIKNVSYFDGEKIVPDSDVVVSDKKIAKIKKTGEKYSEKFDKIIDGEKRLLSPGFIDIHLHGCSGCDVMDGTSESVNKISQTLAEHGTTSYLPTTNTMSPETTRKALAAIRECKGNGIGANILGIHLEGPFINKARKGAQNEKYILKPSVENFNSLVEGNLKDIKRLSLAPETGDGVGLIKYLSKNGIRTSAGHTCASIDVFDKSVDAGLTLCTHLFNGMDPLHHRAPGVVCGVFLHDEVYAEFIADLVHINKDVLKLIVKIKGADKCILISDSISAACMGKGVFSLGGQKVIVKDNAARVESGSLAGSIITVKDAFKNMVDKVGIDKTSVLKMVTVNPAKAIGVDGFKGYIKEGYDADLDLINEKNGIDMTMVMGKIINNG